MLSLALAAAAASPIPQNFCGSDTQVEVTGVISSVAAAPAAPLDSIAPGDSVRVVLSFANDVACSPATYPWGYLVTPDCSTLEVNGVEVGMALTVPNPCLWGEAFGPGFTLPAVAVSADAPFNMNSIRFSLEMEDPLQEVGIGLTDLAQNDVDVTAVTSTSFTISAKLLDPTGAELATVDVQYLDGLFGAGGQVYCDSNPNSTGAVGRMGVFGSAALQDNDITLTASLLPVGVFGFFLNSKDQGFFQNPAGSAGNLCLSNRIGRYIGPGQVQLVGPQGEVELPIDLTQMPTPGGLYGVNPGETWNFQFWFRDVTPQGVSNFTDAISLNF